MSFPVLLILLSAQISHSKDVKSIDPHGSPDYQLKTMNINENVRCKLCHIIKSGKLSLSKDGDTSCKICHTKFPHSGVAEHVKQGLGCLDCHRPHRADLEGNKPDNPQISGLSETTFLRFKWSKLRSSRGLIERKAVSPMLKMHCTGCHEWK